MDAATYAAAVAKATRKCYSQETYEFLLTVRNEAMQVQAAKEFEPDVLSQQVLGQNQTCFDTIAPCKGNAALLSTKPDNANARKICIDECGAAASACNTLLSRGDDFQDLSNTILEFALSGRTLANSCSSGVLSGDKKSLP